MQGFVMWSEATIYGARLGQVLKDEKQTYARKPTRVRGADTEHKNLVKVVEKATY
jgi:hypothetical protein